jgi:AcrR family transcriptional regulator
MKGNFDEELGVTETAQATAATRGQLNHAAIVRAAVDMIERDGEDAVSMRRLAAELGYGAMSLYNHIPNKDALLDAVAEYVFRDFESPVDAGTGWQDQARALVHTFRRVARRYPRCINVVIMRQLNSPTGLRPLESALATARAAGFDGVTAVRITRTFVAYALGSLVNEARLTRRELDAELDGQPYADLDATQFPNIADLADTLLRFDHEADFEFGLDLLITAVEALPRD